MIIIVSLGLIDPLLQKSVLAQLSDPHNTISGNAATETVFMSWLAARPVGLRFKKVDSQRAVVQAVQAGSAADHAGLRQDDILKRVGDLDAPSPKQAAEHINNAWIAAKSAIDLVISRAGRDFYVVLRLHH